MKKITGKQLKIKRLSGRCLFRSVLIVISTRRITIDHGR